MCSSFNSSSIVGSASTVVLGQDGGQLVDGPVEVVIYDLVVVAFGQGNLALGVGEAFLDGGLVVGPPGAEPGFKRLRVGGMDEDQEGVGHLLADLHGPLDVNDK